MNSRASYQPAMPKLLCSRQEAADCIGVSLSTFKELLAHGDIKSVRIGRRRLVPVASLTDYLSRLSAK
jgi:excisionase family DNA binding protein